MVIDGLASSACPDTAATVSAAALGAAAEEAGVTIGEPLVAPGVTTPSSMTAAKAP